MHLDDQQWEKLEEIFSRITLDGDSRRAFVIPIAKAVDKDDSDSPFANWLGIQGQSEFFTIMTTVIRRSKEPALHRALVLEVRKRSINDKDKETIADWIEPKTNSNKTSQTNEEDKSTNVGDKNIESLKNSPEHLEILEQSIKEFEAYRQKQQDLVIKTIEKLLQATKELESNIVKANILSLPENAKSHDIAKAMLSPDRPIDTLRDIVRHWSKERNKFTFSKEDACEFHAIMDILALHSLPIEDRNQVRSAMLRAKAQLQREELSTSVNMPVSASNKVAIDYTVTLLRQTWIILHERGEKVSEMLRLLMDRKPSSQADRFRLLNKVRILNEPQSSNDEEFVRGLTLDMVAQHLINEIEGNIGIVGDPVSHLRDTILPDLYEWEDVAVLFVSNQRKLKEYLSLLEKEFPGVLCLCLSEVEANPYRTVTYTVNSILKNLPGAYSSV